MENLNTNLPETLNNSLKSENSVNCTLDLMENEIEHFVDFTYLGIKNFSNKLIIEIYVRIVIDENDCCNSIFEFILNDITRSKLIEEEKAQIKYKATFLSKIAHEFKNPLISLLEICSQLQESILNFQGLDDDDFIENDLNINRKVLTIKSLSSYILNLVRDCEVIAMKENGAELKPNLLQFNLIEEMGFVQEIVTTLLDQNKKNNTLCQGIRHQYPKNNLQR